MTTTVDIVSYSDADCLVSQQAPIRIESNPLHMHVRTKADDATVWLEVSTANGMITVTDNGSFDTIDIVIPEAKLLALPPGEYVQSLIMSSEGGVYRTEIWRGKFTHSAGPTRWEAGTP